MPALLARLRALRTLLLGELPAPTSPAGPGLAWWVVLTFGAVFFVELTHDLKGDPLLRGAWRGSLFGAVPLAAGMLWALRGRARGLAAIGALLVCVPTVMRLMGPPKASLLAQAPTPAFAALGLGLALVLAAARWGGEPLARWGLATGDWRWWLPRTAAAAVLIVIGATAAMHLSAEMREFYPWYRPARHHADQLLRQQVGLALDFIGWEYLFRGFLLFALARRGDVVAAILFQAAVFFLLHKGKPDVELFLSLPGGILAGWFCWRAGSFLPLWVLHTVQIVSVNLLGFWLRNG